MTKINYKCSICKDDQKDAYIWDIQPGNQRIRYCAACLEKVKKEYKEGGRNE
jgi:hypothetical protein